MTVARGVRSGANCVAERGRLGSFENRSTLPPASRSAATTACASPDQPSVKSANALSDALLRVGGSWHGGYAARKSLASFTSSRILRQLQLT
jgi:hypothetical protein